MATRLAAILAVIPILLSAALTLALPRPATALPPNAEPGIPMPAWRAQFGQGQLVLTGVLPDAAERDALVREAVRVYGRGRVVDQLTVGAVGNPVWLSPSLLPDLRGLAEAEASLGDAHLAITGVATSGHAVDDLVKRLARMSRHGVGVEHRIVIAGVGAGH